MRTIVIGTAGHVDHGKTALVKTLTGRDTDRMAEEKKRGISIDIGFAHLALDEETIVDFVDVPGHERFVRNMVCGTTGIDVALLVVAADDGVMPQTREHLDILKLLGVEKGLVVMTKVDLVDTETREMAELEIAELTGGTFLEKAAVIGCSPATGEGAGRVVEALCRIAHELSPRRSETVFRLPIDKIYSAAGRGSVATGTVAGGLLRRGDEVIVYPLSIYSKARSIQAHRRELEEISCGQRAGVNLAGVDAGVLERGMVVAREGSLAVSRMVNARLASLPSNPRPVNNHDRVKMYVGTKELVCRVIVMEGETIEPGEDAFVQLRCEEEIVAIPGDRFIIRSLSPVTTIGGGVILQVKARKYRKFDARTLTRLSELNACTEKVFVEDAILSLGYSAATEDDFAPLSGLQPERALAVAKELVGSGKVIAVGDGFIHAESFNELRAVIAQTFMEECERLALTRRMKIIELKSKLPFDLDLSLLSEALEEMVSTGQVELCGDDVVSPENRIKLTARQSEVAETALSLCGETGQPVRLATLMEACPRGASEVERVLKYMASEGEIVLLKEMSFIAKPIFDQIKERLIAHMTVFGAVTLAEARDLTGIGRKGLQAILERLDDDGITARNGDTRVFNNTFVGEHGVWRK